MKGGWGGADSLHAVFGGRGALVELVGVVELILAGGIGEVWHRVRGEGDVGRGGDAAAGARRAAPCDGGWGGGTTAKHVTHQ